MSEDFYQEQSQESRVKSIIVAKYFRQWTRVMLGVERKGGGGGRPSLAYIDLFSGPGRYEDGKASTPLIILRTAIQDEKLAAHLQTFFNDRNPGFCSQLQANIAALPGIAKLRFQPVVTNLEVGPEIAEMLRGAQLPPSLMFVDPWGYKGLTLDLIGSVLQGWGCDAIIFFNYNRIRAALSNPIVREHMEALFGPERARRLIETLRQISPDEREATVIDALTEALQETHGRYVLPFCFRNAQGTRTSHHLIFVTKHFRGYEIMKSIMAAQSSERVGGVPSFTYCPASLRQPRLFELNRPLDELAELLLRDFAGATLTMRSIYEKHSVGTPFTGTNYKDVLRRLEAEKRIVASPPADSRPSRKGIVTFSNSVIVSFPK